jgi:hypothetical protein
MRNTTERKICYEHSKENKIEGLIDKENPKISERYSGVIGKSAQVRGRG